ncbi:MAG: PAS domain S-box protein [Deltaproteobacteria bacterium]
MAGDREKIKESFLEELSETWLKVNELETWIADSAHLEERLTKIIECLLCFGNNSLENINRLAALCGELMGATYVVYERLEEAALNPVAGWNMPADYQPIDKKLRNVCWNAIKLVGSRCIVIRDLDQSTHARIDPNVDRHKLKTVVGRAVRLGDIPIGSICTFYDEDHAPTALEEALMGVIAWAIGREEKRSQTARQTVVQQEPFRTIFETSPEAIFVKNENLQYTQVNRAAERFFGKSSSQMIGKTDTELYGETAGSRSKQVENRVLNGALVEQEMTVPIKGTSTTFHAVLTPLRDDKGEVAGLYGIARDMRVQAQAEQALLESRQMLDNILSLSPEGISFVQEGKLKWSNQAMAEMFGYDREEEYLGQKLSEFYSSEGEYKRVLKIVFATFQEHQTVATEARFKRKDGSIFEGSIKVRILDPRNPQKGTIATISDITHRKRAERALKESEERYRTLVEESFDGIFVQKRTKIVFANSRLHKMLGYARGELEGKEHWRVYHPDYQEITRQRAQARMRGESVPSRYEVRLLRKDGSSFEGEVNARAISFGGEPGVQVWIRDITERKRAEEELVRLEKLESTGILAGGIAHDFNNILTAILGNISLGKIYAQPGDKIFHRLEEAEQACHRARGLTQQLLTFSKGGTPIKKALLITNVVKDSCEFALRGSNVRCELRMPDDLLAVEVDAGQLGQVINNLVINADQAMPQGGVIRISGQNVEVTGEAGLPLPHGSYVKISITDEGVGIPPECIPKIFDPYFTTKDGGSGLGLATAYSIIKNHHGMITVESAPDSGTTFHIYLPASRQTAIAGADSKDEPFRGKAKILLMDDEVAIREVAGELLALIGYEVEFAEDGAEAVEMYRKAKNSSAPFNAVIMDLTVPGGIGGKEALDKLRAIDPEIKAIVSSGYSNDPIMANYRTYGFSGVVAKPYSAEDLGKALSKVLDRRS